MRANLAVYLRDHLAGANMAIYVLELVHKHEPEEEQRQSFANLPGQVPEDRDAPEKLQIDVAHGLSVFKNSMGGSR